MNIVNFLTSFLLHALPGLFFLFMGIFSWIGWTVCCCCACCECCCAGCKKECCRTPCFFISVILNVLVMITCLVALGKSNAVFTGLSNTECSVLQFIDQVLNGEKKEQPPKWVGTANLDATLNKITSSITDLKGSPKKGPADAAYTAFKSPAEAYEGSTCTPPSITAYDGYTYCIGYHFCDQVFPKYKLETKTIVTAGLTAVKTVNEAVGSVNAGDISSITDATKDPIDALSKAISDISNTVSDALITYGDVIDEKGKLAFLLIFSVLTILSASVAALVTIYCIFSIGPCARGSCKTCMKAIKIVVTILWNIMALIMIPLMISGGLLKFVGTLGGDLFTTVSCIFGKDNLKAGNKNVILVGSDSTEILRICLHEGGDTSSFFSVPSDFEKKLTDLKQGTSNLENFKSQIEKFRSPEVVNFNNRKNYIETKNALQNDDFLTKSSDDSDKKQASECNSETGCVDAVKGQLTKIQSSFTSMENILELEKTALSTHIELLKDFESSMNEFASGKFFSFLNCKFIGINITLILNYLSQALGSDINLVGVFLIIASVCLCFGIPFTIMTMAMITKKINEGGQVPEIEPVVVKPIMESDRMGL